MDKEVIIVTALVLVAAPFAASMAGANADENATWGLCQADENNDQGDNSSNGTVSETPPFANLTEEDCEDAEHPAEDHPGADDNPGDDAPDGDDGNGEDPPQGPPEEGDDGEDNGEDNSGDKGPP